MTPLNKTFAALVVLFLANLLSINAAAISPDSLDPRADKSAGAICDALYHVPVWALTSPKQGCEVFLFSACCDDTHANMYYDEKHWRMRCHKTAKNRPDLRDWEWVHGATRCKKGWTALPGMYGGCVKGDKCPKTYLEQKCK